MDAPVTLILAVVTGITVLFALGLIVFICCCLRAREVQRRQKRREQLERALAVTPLKKDFVMRHDDEYPQTVNVLRQDPIDDSPSDLQTDDGQTETPDSADNHKRSKSWVAITSTSNQKSMTLNSLTNSQRRKTLAVTSLSPSSSDSSLASFASEPDLEQAGRDSEWSVYQGVSEKPVLNFSLYHSTQDSTLFICLRSVSGLARKYYPGCSSFLKVYILPKFRDGFRTEIVRKSLNPHFNESFQFCELTLAEAQSSFLKVKLYIREKWNRKDRFSGEVFAECHQLLDKADRLLEFKRTFSHKRTKLPKKNLRRMRSKSCSDDAPNRPYLGDVLVTLQYQASAERLKVLVRKAQNLLVDNVIPGTGDIYVSVRLLKHREVVDEQSTQRRAGTSPVWNQPFLFHPKHDDIDNHSIMLSVFRGRRIGSDVIMGKVEIGPDLGETGSQHWAEMVEPRGTDIAKWHRIKPPFS